MDTDSHGDNLLSIRVHPGSIRGPTSLLRFKNQYRISLPGQIEYIETALRGHCEATAGPCAGMIPLGRTSFTTCADHHRDTLVTKLTALPLTAPHDRRCPQRCQRPFREKQPVRPWKKIEHFPRGMV